MDHICTILTLGLILFLSAPNVGAKPKPKISEDLNDVDYYLFAKGNKRFSFKIDVTAQELLNHGFNPAFPTKIVVHGWVKSGLSYATEFAEAYEKAGDFNVIGIDWDKLATIDSYLGAAINSNRVGEHVGINLVDKIFMKQLNQDPLQIHAIGHSLGAHLVGHIGRAVHQSSGRKIARVTGLDPALPYFDLVSIDRRIQATDGEFVDIIHTNSGSLLEGAVSFPDAMGHADFYPNGGMHQAGCTDLCFGVACIGFDLIDFFLGACSHRRAHYLYVESIVNPNTSFLSTACDSYDSYEIGMCDSKVKVPMGEGLTPSMLDGATSTLFYLDTNPGSPYSMS